MAEHVIFVATDIYHVNPEDRCLDLRPGSLTLVNGEVAREELSLPFWVNGVKRHDLAVLGKSIGMDGVTDEGLLVISSAHGQGQLATPEIVESLALYTPELAKKMATLEEHELAQLGLDSLVKSIRKRYPGMKGYVR